MRFASWGEDAHGGVLAVGSGDDGVRMAVDPLAVPARRRRWRHWPTAARRDEFDLEWRVPAARLTEDLAPVVVVSGSLGA